MQDFKLGGSEINKIFFFQICIHIVLINYQPRKIPKNHCFIIYQDQLFEIVFERYGYFPELGYRHFLELWNEYFLGLEHRHFLELGNEYFLKLEHPHFFGIEIATLVVGNPTLTSKEFEYFLLKKSNIVVGFFMI